MNNTVSITLLVVTMVIVVFTLKKNISASAFGSLSSVLLVLVIILVSHFLIKNVLKTRGSKVEEETFGNFFGKKEEEECGVEDFEMKNDLLEYVQNMGSERNTDVEITMKPPTEVVVANSPENKLASYGSENVTDLNSFFQVQRNEACVFTEVPTGTKTNTVPVKMPEVVDKVSRESLYLSSRNDNMVKAQTLEKATWKYDNERVMNGGELFNGVSGYNDMDDGYASVL